MGRRVQLKVLVRVGERVVRDQRRDMGELGRLGLEKLASRRSIKEEIMDGDRCSCRRSNVFDAENLAAGNFNRGSGWLAFHPRSQL
jgi:hypothetical protein